MQDKEENHDQMLVIDALIDVCLWIVIILLENR